MYQTRDWLPMFAKPWWISYSIPYRRAVHAEVQPQYLPVADPWFHRRGRGANQTQCKNLLLPPAMKLGQGYIFTGVCEFCPQEGVPALGGAACSRGGLLWGVSAPGDAWSGGGAWSGGSAPRGGAWWRPPRTATAAGGTHPTGMHSCLTKFLPTTAWKWNERNWTGVGRLDPPMLTQINFMFLTFKCKNLSHNQAKDSRGCQVILISKSG